MSLWLSGGEVTRRFQVTKTASTTILFHIYQYFKLVFAVVKKQVFAACGGGVAETAKQIVHMRAFCSANYTPLNLDFWLRNYAALLVVLVCTTWVVAFGDIGFRFISISSFWRMIVVAKLASSRNSGSRDSYQAVASFLPWPSHRLLCSRSNLTSRSPFTCVAMKWRKV